MRNLKSTPQSNGAAGFTLPAILVVVGALLILAVGVLLMVGIERNTARSFVDRQRAELAAKAGLEEVSGLLNLDAANDEYVVIQSTLKAPITAGRDLAPQLFIARGKAPASAKQPPEYRYTPLFSNSGKIKVPETTGLSIPELEPIIGTDPNTFCDFETLPHQDKVRTAWLPVINEKGKMVARYAYWVEDLQSRLDARTAGNKIEGGNHKRYGWQKGDTSNYAKFPAPGLNAEPSELGDDGLDRQPPLNQIALFALDPSAGATDSSKLDNTIIDGRGGLVSPGSVLSVAGLVPPLSRDDQGRLTDSKARAVESGLTASVKPYDEQPLVPFAEGISSSAVGKPKLNLNAIIAKSPDAAVNEMASWIDTALPEFDGRKGGFPEDYLKTLAANAVGYAAPENQSVVQMGSYRGLGASPMLSEILLDINYKGKLTEGRNTFLTFEFILFAELFNHTNVPIKNGKCQLSYEVGLNLPRIGSIPIGVRFDDESLLNDKNQNPNDLTFEGSYFWTTPQSISLNPGEYKFFKFATVSYKLRIGSGAIGQDFVLTEPMGAAGLSMKWNDKEVERIPKMVREPFGLKYLTNFTRYFGKACIPGHTYGPFGLFINNLGDPRIAHYMTTYPLGENSFPDNISPQRRNIRFATIYSLDGPTKPKIYGRVIPSEWPDGGHDVPVSAWSNGWTDSMEGSVGAPAEGNKPAKLPFAGTGPGFDPTKVAGPGVPEEGNAITYLSNRGRFYSATELGRLYDPIMYLPTFDPTSKLDSKVLRADGEPVFSAGIMPEAGASWPLVQVDNTESKRFGGGNTLRIGRPEHPKFNLSLTGSVNHTPAEMPGTHAARLLDLFHAGKSRSEDAALRQGPLVRIEGHVNINTASKEALRAMAAGILTMDPKLSKRTSTSFDASMAPRVETLKSLSAPTLKQEADVIADAIIAGRPYTSASELACARSSKDTSGKPVFGNKELYADKDNIQWSDSAAEELFGRVYESSTVRSRNFRVWVVGQAVAPTDASSTNPEVLSEVRKAYTIFADAGKREADGTIAAAKFRTKIIDETDF